MADDYSEYISGEYISTFVSKCIIDGQLKAAKIAELAQDEISSLEDEIKVIESLREKQKDLKQLIAKFKPQQQKQDKIIDTSISEEHLSSFQKKTHTNICEFIEKRIPDSVRPREILNIFINEEQSACYTGIKWLLEHEIICRHGEGVYRTLAPGSKWDERPISTNKDGKS